MLDNVIVNVFLQRGLNMFVIIRSECTRWMCESVLLSNLHLSNQTGVWCLIWQLNLHLARCSTPGPPLHEISFSLFSNVTLSLPCALAEDQAAMAERSFRLQVTILAEGGVEWKKLMGHSSRITSTIAKRKPFLEGGNKELSVWVAPFGRGEILSAATAPPSCSWADYDSGAGWAEPVPRPTAPLTIVEVGFCHLHTEDEREHN